MKLHYGDDTIALRSTVNVADLAGQLAAAARGSTASPWVEVAAANGTTHAVLITPGLAIRLSGVVEGSGSIIGN